MAAPLWATLCHHLSPPPATLGALLNALKAVRRAVHGHWRFDGLRELLSEDLDDDERAAFWGRTLPGMCALALRLPKLCP